MVTATISLDGEIIKESVLDGEEIKIRLDGLVSFYIEKLQEVKKAG